MDATEVPGANSRMGREIAKAYEPLQIEPRWFNPPSCGEETAFKEAAERYAAFVGLPL